MAFLINPGRDSLQGLRRTRTVVAALGFAWLAAFAHAASTTVNREPEVKAAAIYNILAFTDWPETAFPSSESPLVIGVLGEGTVAIVLQNLVVGEKWRGRRVVLQRVTTTSDAAACHVLYVARSEHGRWRQISKEFSRHPILTVSDAPNFARNGGMLQLAIERNKLRLIVNLGVARTCGVLISSKVLRLANVIDAPAP